MIYHITNKDSLFSFINDSLLLSSLRIRDEIGNVFTPCEFREMVFNSGDFDYFLGTYDVY